MMMRDCLLYFRLTRPAFLSITLLGCLMGYVLVPPSEHRSPALNGLALLLALIAHASANVLNDYFDHLNHSDAVNVDRIYPFTGGSRFIQNHLVSPKQTLFAGLLLFFIAALLGAYLINATGMSLLPLGALGLLLVWAYSAPPFQLMSRGMAGELAIALAWSLLVVGFAGFQSLQWLTKSAPLGLGYGLMVANILYLNQIPDIKADKHAGKRTLAASCSPKHYWAIYLLLVMIAYTIQAIGVITALCPSSSLASLVVLPAFIHCCYCLKKSPNSQHDLKRIIINNLIAVHVYAAMICLALYAL